MDLGSLELQIFVSLVVVLGAAFVALICDYLKGNNEQLRERNIELRVRKEEQERQVILDPAGFLARYQAAVQPLLAATQQRLANAMAQEQGQALERTDPGAVLAAIDQRVASMRARGAAEEDVAAAPPVFSGHPQSRAAKRRERTGAKRNGRPRMSEWVRPEVMAKVALRGASMEIPDFEQADAPSPAALAPDPVAAFAQSPEPAPAVLPEAAIEIGLAGNGKEVIVPPFHAQAAETRDSGEDLQKEIERVARMDQQGAAGRAVPILRPLTVPTLRLDEELQRLAAAAPVPAEPEPLIHSALLEEVIQASVVKSNQDIAALTISGADQQPEAEAVPGPAPMEDFPVPDSAWDSVSSQTMTGLWPGGPVEPVPVFADAPSADAFFASEISYGEVPQDSGLDAPEPVMAQAIAGELPPAPAPEAEPVLSFASSYNSFDAAVALPHQESHSTAELDSFAAHSLANWAVEPETLPEEPQPEIEADAHTGAESAAEPLPVHSWEPPSWIPPMVSEIVPPFQEAGVPAADFESRQQQPAKPEPQVSATDGEWELSKEWHHDAAPEAFSLPPVVESTPVLRNPSGWGLEMDLPTASLSSSGDAPPSYWLRGEDSPPESGAPISQQIVQPLELPHGMQDQAAWLELLEQPNPMSGIVFVISLQVPGDPAVGDQVSVVSPEVNSLMNSFLREGDFGCRVSDTQWLFVYEQDEAGFNQRRVASISEKLWDFQLRHLGTSALRFQWGAVDVTEETLADAVNAARARMEQSRKTRKTAGFDLLSGKKVVNA